ncbi:hypothetical protein A5320_02280 [Rheinheimera sp. SA_1]|nr:hypothetical protein A5320_02280 [Rheinheimera sp. SA_1]
MLLALVFAFVSVCINQAASYKTLQRGLIRTYLRHMTMQNCITGADTIWPFPEISNQAEPS